MRASRVRGNRKKWGIQKPVRWLLEFPLSPHWKAFHGIRQDSGPRLVFDPGAWVFWFGRSRHGVAASAAPIAVPVVHLPALALSGDRGDWAAGGCIACWTFALVWAGWWAGLSRFGGRAVPNVDAGLSGSGAGVQFHES